MLKGPLRPTALALPLSLATLLALTTGCSDEGPPASAEGGNWVELARDTRILDDAALSHLETVSQDGTTFTFEGATDVITDLVKGQVLVGGVSAKTPYGLLRRVAEVSRSGDETEVVTTQATLTDAITSGHVSLARKLRPADVTRTLGAHPQVTGGAPGFYLALPQVVLADADGSEQTTDDRITVDGTVSVDPDVSLNLDIGLLHVDEATLSLSADEAVTASLRGRAALGWSKQWEVAKYELAPIVIPIPTPMGVFPVVFLPELSVVAAVSGHAGGTIDVGFVQAARFGVGVGYESGKGWGVFGDPPTGTVEKTGPSLGASADARVEAGPRVALLLYGVTGPRAGVSAYFDLDAELARTPCYSLSAGIDAALGFEVSLLGIDLADYETSKQLWSTSLGSGACDGKPIPTWSKAVWFDPLYEPAPGRLVGSPSTGYAMLIGDPASVVKLREDGTIEWARRYENSCGTSPRAAGLAATDDGGYLLAGRVACDDEAFVARLDAEGEVVWSRTFGGAASPRPQSVACSPAGCVVVGEAVGTGAHAPGPSAEVDAWVMKLAPNGSVVWSVGVGDAKHDVAADVVESNGYVVVGETSRDVVKGGFTVEESEPFAFRLSANGELVWSSAMTRSEGVVDFLIGQADAVAAVGSKVVVAGSTLGPMLDTATHAFTLELDALTGAPGFRHSYGGTTTVSSILSVGSGGFLLSGASGPVMHPDAWLGRLDATGGMVWSKTYGGTAEDQGYGVRPTSDGGFVVAAASQSFASLGQLSPVPWLLRLPRDGAITFAASAPVTMTSTSGTDLAEFWTTTSPGSTVVPIPMAAGTTSIVALPKLDDVHYLGLAP